MSALAFVPFALHLLSAGTFGVLALRLYERRGSALARASLALIVPFAWWSLSLALAHLPGMPRQVATVAYHLTVLGWAPFGSAALLFGITYLRPDLLRARPLWVALAAPPVLVVIAHWAGALAAPPLARPWGWAYAWREGAAVHLFSAYYAIYTGLALAAVLRVALAARSPIRRAQARMIALPGIATLGLATVTDVVLPRVGVAGVPNVGADLMVIWAIGLAIAVDRYRILELTPTVAIDRIVETMSDALFLTTPAGAITWTNPAALALTGDDAATLRARGLPDVLGLGPEGWDELLATGRGERVLRHRDGWERRVGVSSALLRDRGGRPAGVVCVARDVTAIRAEMEARVRADQRYRQLVENMQEGMWVLDHEDRVTLVNPRMAALLGVPAAAQRGRTIGELVDASAQATVQVALAAARAGGSSQGEWRLGATAQVAALVHVAPLPTEGGGYEGAIVTATDLTDRKKTELALAQADRLSTVGRLAAGVGHDINNPLTYVLANLEEIATLTASPGDPAAALAAVRAAAAEAQAGVLRVRAIVADLRRFAISEATDAGPIDVHKPIEDALKFAMNELRFRARLVRAYGEALPPIVGDRVKLSQVLLNLLVNAAHAIPEGDPGRHEVRVRTWSEGGRVHVAVEDTGSGIRPGDLPHIFDPFFSTKQRTGGTGLGLAISREIVVGLGGTLEATSELGAGARFVVSLPASAAAPASERRRPRTPTENLRGLRVLIVDDEPLIRASLARSLARRVAVTTAGSVAEAIALISDGPPLDLVLCDVMMPDALGLELGAWLAARQHPLADRLVYLTGGVFTPEVERGLAAHPHRVLEKPVSGAELLRTIDEVAGATRRVATG